MICNTLRIKQQLCLEDLGDSLAAGVDQGQNRRPAKGMARLEAARRKFNERIRMDSEMKCWEWLGRKDKNGYGLTSSRLLEQRAHRESYKIKNGAIPNNLCVLHHCDNPSCVNPNHLFLGTNADNMKDKCDKGRQSKGAKHSASLVRLYGDRNPSVRHPERLARGDRNGARVHIERMPRGERNGFSKLKESDVIAIRKIFSEGKTTRIRLAIMFGVSKSLITPILTRKLWKHI